MKDDFHWSYMKLHFNQSKVETVLQPCLSLHSFTLLLLVTVLAQWLLLVNWEKVKPERRGMASPYLLHFCFLPTCLSTPRKPSSFVKGKGWEWGGGGQQISTHQILVMPVDLALLELRNSTLLLCVDMCLDMEAKKKTAVLIGLVESRKEKTDREGSPSICQNRILGDGSFTILPAELLVLFPSWQHCKEHNESDSFK